ncbi:MAG: DUF4340 domain-containing protein [Gammaproteobacteria bacterium]|nr:DUF4340 domain-containing protein [Gammaproteobacteria bacterium]NNJ98077.1 DUF4340 domain-containing protein [Gammaproteobacteria bacterium]
MRSRALLNLALLILIAVLGYYAYTTHQQQNQDDTAFQLTALSADKIEHIIIRHNQRSVELRKSAGRWRMLQPIDIAANSFRIDTLLKLLNTVSHASYVVAELNPETYGLSDINTSIQFNDVVIEFGGTNPINNYRYVRIGDRVHLIDDHYYPLLSSQVGTLVARQLLAGDIEIDKLVLPEMTLYRDDNQRWQSSSATNPDLINETLHHWKNSQAFGVHNYMARESLADISVYLSGEVEPLRFHVTDIDPWLIIARPDLDLEYHFNLEFYERLLPGADTSGEADESGE